MMMMNMNGTNIFKLILNVNLVKIKNLYNLGYTYNL